MKTINRMVLLLATLFAAIGCSDDDKELVMYSLRFEPNSITLGIGKSYRLVPISDPFYDDVHVAAERFQCVMDCDPGVKVAPTAVEFYGDVGFVLHGRQIFHEALRRDIEAGLRLACPPVDRLLAHNVAVEGDLALVLADACYVPELCRCGCGSRYRCRAHVQAMWCFHWLSLLVWIV